MIPKRPGEGEEVEQIETAPITPTDIFIEREAAGVIFTLAMDDREEDLAILFTPAKARELGDMLYRLGCD